MPERLARHVAQVLAVLHEPVDDLERPADVPDRDDVGELELDLAPRRAEQRRTVTRSTVLPAEHGRLVQQRERVAGRAFGLARDRLGGRRIEFRRPRPRDRHEMRGEVLRS